MKLKMTVFAFGAVALVAAGCNKQTAQNQPNNQVVTQGSVQQNNTATSSDTMMKDEGMSDNKVVAVLLRDNLTFTVWPGDELFNLDHEAMLDNNITVSKTGLVKLANGATVQLKNGQEVDRKGVISQASSDLLKMKAMMIQNDTMMKNKASGTNDSMMHKPGAYINYTSEALASAEKSGGRTVIFFHANWCPYCKAAEADFKAHMDKIPSGVTILQADYDSETALKQKYGIVHQDAFVQVDSGGNSITQWTSGGLGIQTLLANLKN